MNVEMIIANPVPVLRCLLSFLTPVNDGVAFSHIDLEIDVGALHTGLTCHVGRMPTAAPPQWRRKS